MDARQRDLSRNSGWAHAAGRRKVNNVLGAKVRLQVKPNIAALRISADEGRALAKAIEAEWEIYTGDEGKYVDAGRRLTFGGMARVAYWHHFYDGRCLILPVWLPNRGGRYGTAFQMVDPQRLSNPRGLPDSYTLRGGIEINRYGAPTAYHIRNQHPGDLILQNPRDSYSWTRIPAETQWGRRRVIHWFDQFQAEQSNGISILTIAMKRLRMLETRSDLELQKAAIKASYAAFVKSSLPSDVLFKALTEAPDGTDDDLTAFEDFTAFQTAYHAQRGYTFNGSKVGQLLPGEEFQAVGFDDPGADFEASERVWLRYVAAILDVSYEQLSYDWSQVNYSSARAALNEVWKATTAERDMFGDGVLTPMFALWLEEAIESGRVVLPKSIAGLRTGLMGYVRPCWVGPGRGYIDAKKEREAERIARDGGNLTLRELLAEDGIDEEEHIEQLAREMELLKAAKLPYPGEQPFVPSNDAPEEPPAAGGKK